MKRCKKWLACLISLAMASIGVTPAYAAGQEGISKDENVFVILQPDGSVKEQIVSNWLHSDQGLSEVEDASRLTDIENLKGQLEPERHGDSLRWNTEEKDVYYQGHTEQTPPVTAAITYALDGEAMPWQALIGKSGHVKITITLTNHEKSEREINGQLRDIYTPFFTIIAADLPTAHFSNIIAENGTVQTDASNQLACFLAMPGMRANFDGLLTDKLGGLTDAMLDTVTLEADVNDFQMPMIMMATATSMEELTETETSLPDLEGRLDELKDATGDLQDGAEALAEAASMLKDKMAQLNQSYNAFDRGIISALAGAKALQQGALQLDDGVRTLAEGTQQLQSGSSTLAQMLNDELVPGLTQAAGQQQRLEQKMAAIRQALDSVSLPDMDAMKDELAAGVGSVFDQAAAGAAQGAAGAALNGYSQVLQGVLAGSGLDADMQADILAAVNASLNQNGITAEQIAGSVTGQMGEAKQQAVLQSLKALEGMDLSNLEAIMGQLGELSGEAQSMMDSVKTLTQALYNEEDPADTHTVVGAAATIASGAAQVNGGMDALKKGADRLERGAQELADGLTAVRSASAAIKEAIGQFLEGAGSLQQGAGSLHSGMDTYAQEGIGELIDRMENLNLDGISEVMTAMQDQANGYGSYSGGPTGIKSTVKFVMKVEAPQVEAADENPKAEQAPEAPASFWDRVKGLFD